MALVLTGVPAAEPISLAEAKAHFRIDADDEDALISSLIVAARMFIERTLGLALITQGWSYFLDFWPRSSCVTLPISPVQAVSAVTLYDASGGATVLDAGDYAADVLSQPVRLVLKGASPAVVTRELNAFEIAFTAGYGDAASDVPAPIRQALNLLVAHWFERREPVVLGLSAQEVPATVAGLLAALSPGEVVTEFLPSDLRHRLTLEQLQREEDEGGGFAETWVEVAELSADLRPVGGSEGVEADRLAGRVTHEVALRYRPGVQPAMRFRKNARLFHIVTVINVAKRNRWLKCLCEEREL